MLIDQLPGWSNKTNPYNALLCDALVATGASVRDYAIKQLLSGEAPEIVHVHWPEYGLSRKEPWKARLTLEKLFLGMRLAKLKGARIIWTVHNLRPHERHHPALESTFYRRWLATIDGAVFLSRSSLAMAQERYPALRDLPCEVIPHGDYRPRLSRKWTQSEARSALGLPLESKIVASIGAVRRYKGIPDLVTKFLEIAKAHELLVIAGKCNEADLAMEIQSASKGDPRIKIDDRFLSDDLMESYTVASDFTIFPYTDILNSGSALYALSCSRPIMAPAIGSLPELQQDVGERWAWLYQGDLEGLFLREALDVPTRAQDADPPNLTRYEWGTIGEQTKAFYEQVIHGKA